MAPLALGLVAGHTGWVVVPALLGVWTPAAAAALTGAVAVVAALASRWRLLALVGPALVWTGATAIWAPTALVEAAGVGAALGGVAHVVAAAMWLRPRPAPVAGQWTATAEAPPVAAIEPWLGPGVLAGASLGVLAWPGLMPRVLRAYPAAPGWAAAGLLLFTVAVGLLLAARLARPARPRVGRPGRALLLGIQAVTLLAAWLWWRA